MDIVSDDGDEGDDNSEDNKKQKNKKGKKKKKKKKKRGGGDGGDDNDGGDGDEDPEDNPNGDGDEDPEDEQNALIKVQKKIAKKCRGSEDTPQCRSRVVQKRIQKLVPAAVDALGFEDVDETKRALEDALNAILNGEEGPLETVEDTEAELERLVTEKEWEIFREKEIEKA